MITGDKIIDYLFKGVRKDFEEQKITCEMGVLSSTSRNKYSYNSVSIKKDDITYQISYRPPIQSGSTFIDANSCLEIFWIDRHVSYPISMNYFSDSTILAKQYEELKTRLEIKKAEEELKNILISKLNIPEEEFLEDVQFKNIEEFKG